MRNKYNKVKDSYCLLQNVLLHKIFSDISFGPAKIGHQEKELEREADIELLRL